MLSVSTGEKYNSAATLFLHVLFHFSDEEIRKLLYETTSDIRRRQAKKTGEVGQNKYGPSCCTVQSVLEKNVRTIKNTRLYPFEAIREETKNGKCRNESYCGTRRFPSQIKYGKRATHQRKHRELAVLSIKADRKKCTHDQKR